MATPDRPTISVSNVRAAFFDLTSSAYSEFTPGGTGPTVLLDARTLVGVVADEGAIGFGGDPWDNAGSVGDATSESGSEATFHTSGGPNDGPYVEISGSAGLEIADDALADYSQEFTFYYVARRPISMSVESVFRKGDEALLYDGTFMQFDRPFVQGGTQRAGGFSQNTWYRAGLRNAGASSPRTGTYKVDGVDLATVSINDVSFENAITTINPPRDYAFIYMAPFALTDEEYAALDAWAAAEFFPS